MAQKIVVELTDDLDGGVADETVTFGHDGRTYEIDLTSDNATALADALAPYVAVARPVSQQGRQRPRATVVPAAVRRRDTPKIRAWARDNGWPDLGNRGRVPKEAVDAYDRTHP